MKQYLFINNDLSRSFEYCDTNNSKISKQIEIVFYQNVEINDDTIKRIVEIVWDDYELSDIHALLDFLENNRGRDISLYTE